MEGRGVSDRGPGEVSDALRPTKVKGRMSPGGPMPSITLKGVSIKGQSTVSYQEAAPAAQSDAESALSQDKVPRAYQEAVKDYFDDRKNDLDFRMTTEEHIHSFRETYAGVHAEIGKVIVGQTKSSTARSSPCLPAATCCSKACPAWARRCWCAP